MPSRILLTTPPESCPRFPPVTGGRTGPVTGHTRCLLEPRAFYADAMAAHELLALVRSLASALDRVLPLARLSIPVSGHPVICESEDALSAASPWVEP